MDHWISAACGSFAQAATYVGSLCRSRAARRARPAFISSSRPTDARRAAGYCSGARARGVCGIRVTISVGAVASSSTDASQYKYKQGRGRSALHGTAASISIQPVCIRRNFYATLVEAKSEGCVAAWRAPPEGRAYTPHHRRHLQKAHLPFRGPRPRASPRDTKPGRGSTRTVNR